MFSDVANGTVIEFDSVGNVSVVSTLKPGATRVQKKIQRATAIYLPNQKLARDIAIRFSGTNDVRSAGLDALTFVDLFETLIQRESAFDPNAVSPKGAQGLGQLMPDTATDLGVSNPFDPTQNLIGSAKYFIQHLVEFQSVELALAAYNAGPQRVRDYGKIPPFEETKAYVAWIMNKVGLKPSPQKTPPPIEPVSVSKKRNATTEQPLNGEISVWEF